MTLPPPESRYTLDPNDLPRHGALPRLLRWEVVEEGAGRSDRIGAGAADQIVARLEWDRPELLALFPYPHRLLYEARCTDAELAITITVLAGPDGEVPVAFGLHPYLQMPGVPRRDWRVSLGARRRLLADDLLIPTGESEPLAQQDLLLGDHSFDDGLADLSDSPEFAVADGARRLRVVFDEGFGLAQVYAPSDQDVICFEPMTAPTNALVSGRDLPTVAPSGEYRAAFRIVVADNEVPPV